MKVKCNTSELNYLTYGKEYTPFSERNCEHSGKQYILHLDNNSIGIAHHSHFTPVPDAPQIEVGGEWVEDSNCNNQNFTVLYVGKQRAFIAMDGVEECSVPLSAFGDEYKPKPKTVTMYFYKDKCGLHARELDFGDSLFKREIEL